MQNLGPFAMLTGVGSAVSIAIALFSAWKTYEKVAAQQYAGAAAFFVRFALSALIAYALLGVTFGFFPGLAATGAP